MEDQLNLFDTRQFSINHIIAIIRGEIIKGWHPFSVDNVQKAAILNGVSCGIVLDTYEKVTYEVEKGE
jgi:hypothetical protein